MCCVDLSPVSYEMCVTRSYDYMVKLWDVREASPKSVVEVNHGKPVDSIYDKSRCIWVFIGLWGENDWEFECGDVCWEAEDEG